MSYRDTNKPKIYLVHLEITPLKWMLCWSNHSANYQRKIMFLCFILTIDYKIN